MEDWQPNMGIGYFITGTDTNIGKTIATTLLVEFLQQQGFDAIPYKPIQSGTVWKNNRNIGEDVAFYKENLHLTEEPSYYNTYTLHTPVSPHLACKLENQNMDEELILRTYKNLEKKHDVVIVEGAGGVAVPLKDDFNTINLIKLLNISVIIVTTLRLGTINHTLLTTEYLKSHNINIKGFIINRVPLTLNEMEEDNLFMIKKLTGLDVIGWIPDMGEIKP
ncbi:dethiobiotin synthase [Peribacillus alkalitolerans]|uniref:dethiobiotin synthase n=1 Tax=Peribacillus alkalitolerans TaxID=1550385 RepID=UPI0013D2E3C4|nr:dethiobiotin synthase [Peribacillus alkalitolerans]